MKKILVIIPCYNEEHSLPGVLSELEMLDGYAVVPLVVNDCSKDGTARIAFEKKVALLDLPINLGIGGAVQAGLIYAHEKGFDLAIQMDGDGQHPANQLHKLIERQQKTGASIVIGSRYITDSSFRSTFMRRIGIRYFSLLSKLLTGKRIYDSTSGYRLFDKRAIEVAAKFYPDEYPEPESLVIFSRLGLNIEEVSVDMRKRQGGQSSIGSLASLYYMVKVSLAMLTAYSRYFNRKAWQEYRS